MVISDLDDTLLTTNKELTEKNKETIRILRSKKISVVIATGRPLHFIKKIPDLEELVDYFIVSTGLGIWDCKTKQIIYKKSFTINETDLITRNLIDKNIDFMRHEELPENHYCQVFSTNKYNVDLKSREKNFKGFCTSFNKKSRFKSSVFILPGIDNMNIFQELKNELPWVSIIRLTSPYCPGKYWIEILPLNINKGTAVQILSDLLEVKKDKRIIIGNDYNDMDMLILSEKSYVVSNAVNELKDRFIVVAGCDENGFTTAVEHAGLI